LNIGIIGGGMAGLTAAYELGKRGHRVAVFERNAELGGQASTFEVGGERLEKFYHHIFTGDADMIRLIDELGLSKRLTWLESRMGTYYGGRLYKFATPVDLLRFSPLSPLNRIRLGLISLWLQRYKNWHNLEHITARDWIIKYAGRDNYQVVWEPLLRGKFGEKSDEVGMVWFWGRIYLRMASRGAGMQKERLGYINGSFGLVTDALAHQIENAGGVIHTSSPVERVLAEGNKVNGIEVGGQIVPFDAVIATVPSSAFLKLVPQLPSDHAQKLESIRYQAAACLVLVLNKPFTPFYWINIGDRSVPFVATVEHTNFIPENRYGGHHILYISNYLSSDSPLYGKDADELLAEYLPYLEKINPNFERRWVEELYLFREESAQPIVGTNYSSQIPEYRTPIEGLYLANTTQIYPEDRGMNCSIRLGHTVSKLVDEDLPLAPSR
jgi:protoporphyrinogen oxidase